MLQYNLLILAVILLYQSPAINSIHLCCTALLNSFDFVRRIRFECLIVMCFHDIINRPEALRVECLPQPYYIIRTRRCVGRVKIDSRLIIIILHLY